MKKQAYIYILKKVWVFSLWCNFPSLYIVFHVHVYQLLFFQQVMLPQYAGLMSGYTFEYVID